MDKIWETMLSRHSVRQYTDRKIEEEKRQELRNEINRINSESGLDFQLFCDEPEAFDGLAPHYGSFSGCMNYFVLAGEPKRDEAIGYFGERLVLKAQELGLNTCWVAVSYRKGKIKPVLKNNEEVYVVIALGYGKTNGIPHKNRKISDIAEINDSTPDWFRKGVEAAMLAPTAINQQKFLFEKTGERTVKGATRLAFYGKMDLGIAKYHFELGAGKENFDWE